jgi:arginyl-tRNA synthetase
MDIFADFDQRVARAIERLGWKTPDGAALDLSRVVVEPPRDAANGDLAVNAAMVLAKQVGKNPRALAIELMGELAADPDVAETEVAGPGFLNLRLSPTYWAGFLAGVVRAGAEFGRGATGKGAVNVEYVSANPTGPMHVGHCRDRKSVV